MIVFMSIWTHFQFFAVSFVFIIRQLFAFVVINKYECKRNNEYFHHKGTMNIERNRNRKKRHWLNEINAKQDGNHNCFFRNWINYKNKTRTFCVFIKSFMESSHSKRPHIDPFVCLLTTQQSYRWIVANELLIVFWLDGRSDYCNHFRLFNTRGVYLYDGT